MADTEKEVMEDEVKSAAIAGEEKSILDDVKLMLDTRNAKGLKVLIQNDEDIVIEQIKQAAWDLVPLICSKLTHQLNSTYPKFLQRCELLLKKVVDVSNAKEVLLVLLEQAECSVDDDVKFSCLISAIQNTLFRLPAKRLHSLEISLETLYSHLKRIDKPEDHNLEGKEKKLLDEDPDIRRINMCTLALLEFLVPFVKEVPVSITSNVKHLDSTEKQRLLLSKFLIQLLDHPLCYIDLSNDVTEGKSTESNSHLCAVKLMEYMIHLQGDFHRFTQNIVEENEVADKKSKRKNGQFEEIDNGMDDENVDVEEPTSMIGLSCFAYLVLGEGLGRGNIPSIYRHEYLFEVGCLFVSILFREKESLVVDKGVRLVEGLIKYVSANSMTTSVLDSSNVCAFIQDIIHVIVYCPSKEIRQQAVKVLPSLLSKFDSRGRYQFILKLIHTGNHSGLVGYTIGMLKDEIDMTLKSVKTNEYFLGSHLVKLLNVVFTLPDGATTDLLNQNDRIMATLNLLRFLILRDSPQKNVTGIWNMIPQLESSYCKLLHSALNMTKAHYNLELQNTQSSKGKSMNQNEPEVSLTIAGQCLPDMTEGQQLQVLQMALYTLDMMESVLCRVSELISAQKNK